MDTYNSTLLAAGEKEEFLAWYENYIYCNEVEYLQSTREDEHGNVNYSHYIG